jgi:UrcA family protein
MGKLATRVLLLGGLAGLSLAGAAGAGTPLADAPALVVHYSDATLATDSGVRALYHRLAQAAEQVCPVEPSNTHIINEKILKCREEALSAAVSKIHNQRLAALHAANWKAG